MLCINLTSVRDNKPIYLANRLEASRLYISATDIPSFPNRLVFTLTEQALQDLLGEVSAAGEEEWLESEVAGLNGGTAYAIVPFALRVQEETYTSFYQRAQGCMPHNAINLGGSRPNIFIRGVQMPIICLGCDRQATLQGRQCPDYQPDNYACFQSSRFTMDGMETFYLNEKGEMVYNAASVGDAPGEQMEDNAGTSGLDA